MKNKQIHNESCPHCGQTHQKEMEDRKEVIKIMAKKFTDELFKTFWKDQKEQLEILSKKELSEEVFFQAIAIFLDNTLPDKPEK